MEKKIDLISSSKKSFWTLNVPIIGFAIFDAVYDIIDMHWISKMNPEAYFEKVIAIPLFTLIASSAGYPALTTTKTQKYRQHTKNQNVNVKKPTLTLTTTKTHTKYKLLLEYTSQKPKI